MPYINLTSTLLRHYITCSGETWCRKGWNMTLNSSYMENLNFQRTYMCPQILDYVQLNAVCYKKKNIWRQRSKSCISLLPHQMRQRNLTTISCNQKCKFDEDDYSECCCMVLSSNTRKIYIDACISVIHAFSAHSCFLIVLFLIKLF